MDLNAVQHPLGVGGTWSPNQKTAINHYLEDEWTDPKTGKVVIRWGENYTSRTDGMHFEINADEAAVTRALSAYLARREAEENPLMALSDDDAAKIGAAVAKALFAPTGADGIPAITRALWFHDSIPDLDARAAGKTGTDGSVTPATVLARILEETMAARAERLAAGPAV